MAILEQGKTVQIGTPYEIYNRPSARYVAVLVGSPRINVWRSTIGGGAFRASGSDFFIPLPEAADVDHPVDLAVRQEDVALGPEGEDAQPISSGWSPRRLHRARYPHQG